MFYIMGYSLHLFDAQFAFFWILFIVIFNEPEEFLGHLTMPGHHGNLFGIVVLKLFLSLYPPRHRFRLFAFLDFNIARSARIYVFLFNFLSQLFLPTFKYPFYSSLFGKFLVKS